MKDEKYMQRCLDLARNGLGKVSPNPLVGSVIVHENLIIGEGWHHKLGEAHAEVNAVNSVIDKSLLANSTLYVNLEPCAHFGKTPPCADLIIASRIPRVVIANVDPHKAVAGKGIQRMREAGIEVKEGVLEKEGRFLNRRFFCYHEKQRPFVILKWAESQDGFMDMERTSNNLGVNWITQAETQSLVHQWRTEEDAIMIGGNTLKNDNPLLTSRAYWGGNPIPVVIGSESIKQSDFNLLNNKQAIWITSNDKVDNLEAEVVVTAANQSNPEAWLQILKERNIQSVLVEGGARLLQSFIDAKAWDEIRILRGTKTFTSGLRAPKLSAEPVVIEHFGSDNLKTYFS